jgi:predicted nucleotidyltransferase
MSGNYVQRGTPAIIDKYLRTELCLLNGADLVLELPIQFSSGSAEFFASAAVSLLNSSGIVDELCFGCEFENISILNEIATLLNNEPDNFSDIILSESSKGNSFPKSRSIAIKNFHQNFFDLDNILSSPNNILAIEYIKTLQKTKSR